MIFKLIKILLNKTFKSIEDVFAMSEVDITAACTNVKHVPKYARNSKHT